MTFVRGRNGGNFRHSVMMPSKGLLNNPGENNCFMNSAVQVLWHLDVFRRSFRLIEGHACLKEGCIFCALKEIFEKFQASDEDALPPDVLRIAMAKAFQDQHKFQIGRMDDAAECFENILRRLHFHIAYKEPEDMCNAKNCISHQKFAMQILEQTSCKCGATSEPLNFFQIVHYVSASALIYKASQPGREGHRPYRSFGELLRATVSLGEKTPCPDDKKCMYMERNHPPTKMHRTLLNSPDIVGIGINWDTDRPSADYVMDLLDCLGKKLAVKDIFDNVSDEKARKMKLRLVGIMTYYGKHYTTFFYNTRQKSWFYFDDAKVKEIGEDWDLVKAKCKRGRFQPLLVLYANPEGEPIDHVKASKTVKVLNEEDLQRLQLDSKDPGEVGREEGLRPIGKKKSFKKIVGSAFKKSKRKQNRYTINHMDMILTVNGQHTSESELERVVSDESFNEAVEDKSCHNNKQLTLRDTNSAPVTPVKCSKPYPDSPESIVKDEKVTGGRSLQAQRLVKHKRHLSSIESNADRHSEASDYDNLESPRSLGHSRKVSSLSDSHGPVFLDKEVFVEGENQRKSSSDKSPRDNLMARFEKTSFDIKDNFDRAIDAAERILKSSFTAENEGNLIEAFHLCTEANSRYRAAIDMPGLLDRMKQYADKKRWETHDRSRFLNNLIDRRRGKFSKSADFVRGTSKTSDYGSLSDTSCSPVTPLVSESAQNVIFKSSMTSDILEEPRLSSQAKKILRAEATKDDHNLQKPSVSEMEQLSALLQDFGVEGETLREDDKTHNALSSRVSQPTQILSREVKNENDSNSEANVEARTRRQIIVTKIVSHENVRSHVERPATEMLETKQEIITRQEGQTQITPIICDNISTPEEQLQAVDNMLINRGMQQDVKKTSKEPILDRVLDDGKGSANNNKYHSELLNKRNKQQQNEHTSYRQRIRAAGSKLAWNLPGKLSVSHPGLSHGNASETLSQSDIGKTSKCESRPFDRPIRRLSLSKTFLGQDVSKGAISRSRDPFSSQLTQQNDIESTDSQNGLASPPVKSSVSRIVSHLRIGQQNSFQPESTSGYNDVPKQQDPCLRNNGKHSAQQSSKVSIILKSQNIPLENGEDHMNDPKTLSNPSSSPLVCNEVLAANHPERQLKLPKPPAKRIGNKWPLDADFSNSPRQMCEQCGTVTVEKPKKFCSKCQSDYL